MDAIGDLQRLHVAGDRHAMHVWVDLHAGSPNLSPLDVVLLFTHLVAKKMVVALDQRAEFYRLELADDATAASRMCGRLITAAANDDDATVQALVNVVSTWTSQDRAELLTTMIHIVGWNLD